ncbi:oligosaccharide flippase family protein [Flagellimonas sp. CMM7]|uniref:oligosaccharide flippase family protein n=1 Tax=Flagellimonas sp. CMM7 TaxID=2654676 RepID=UPI0013D5B40C|nr:oligosaccharide flippase family protein [Flagellimonas sp. CMM7]UII81569.1 oligosaccharide flippase family protein [Flagellimonas sp. CMM7]
MFAETLRKLKSILRKGFFHLFFSNFLAQFMVFGSHMLVASLLLPEELGKIKVLQTFVDVASIIGGGGLIVAILKIVPQSTKKAKQYFVLQYVLKNAFLFSFIVFFVLNTLAFFGLLSSDNQINQLFHLFSIVILISPISLLMIRYYQALELFKKASIIQVITKMFSVTVIILLTYYFAIRGYVVAVIIGFLVTALFLLFDLRDHIFSKNNIIEYANKLKSEIKNLSKFNFFAQVSDQFRIYVTFFVANYLITDREIFGQYSFALILVQALGVLSSSAQQFVIPKFSKESNNGKLFFSQLRYYEKQYFIAGLFIFLCFQLIAPYLISYFFDGKYDSSIPLLRVMLIGWLVYSAFTLKGPAFIGLGRLDVSFKVSSIALVIAIPLSILLCYHWGIWGIVISYVAQTAVSCLLSNYFMNLLKKTSLS